MIKVTPKVSVPSIPSNYSNEELVRVIRLIYPDLNGPLDTLLTRFEYQCVSERFLPLHSPTCENPSSQQLSNSEIACVHCGSLMSISLWEDK